MAYAYKVWKTLQTPNSTSIVPLRGIANSSRIDYQNFSSYLTLSSSNFKIDVYGEVSGSMAVRTQGESQDAQIKGFLFKNGSVTLELLDSSEGVKTSKSLYKLNAEIYFSQFDYKGISFYGKMSKEGSKQIYDIELELSDLVAYKTVNKSSLNMLGGQKKRIFLNSHFADQWVFGLIISEAGLKDPKTRKGLSTGVEVRVVSGNILKIRDEAQTATNKNVLYYQLLTTSPETGTRFEESQNFLQKEDTKWILVLRRLEKQYHMAEFYAKILRVPTTVKGLDECSNPTSSGSCSIFEAELVIEDPIKQPWTPEIKGRFDLFFRYLAKENSSSAKSRAKKRNQREEPDKITQRKEIHPMIE